MSKFVEVRASELFGSALDWAVAKAVGLTEEKNGLRFDRAGRPTVAGYFAIPYQPSTNWAQGGPLIERELIEVSPRWHNQHCAVNQDWEKRGFKADHGWHWSAYVLGADNIDDNHEQEGGTLLIAAMRCFVSDKLGDVVQVPAELVGEVK